MNKDKLEDFIIKHNNELKRSMTKIFNYLQLIVTITFNTLNTIVSL